MSYRVQVLNSRIITIVQTGDGARWTRDKAKQTERTARTIAPKRTGRLASSHVTLPTRGSNQYHKVYRVSAQAPYSRFVHEGTHGPITGRNGWVKIPAGRSRTGRAVITRSVRGQRPNPWLARAAMLVAHS